MDEKEAVFVLIPFDKEHDAVYDGHIKPICEEFEYEVNKADTTSTQQNIIRDIITGIRDADLLIADLTGGNPNVYYEVGIADALGMPTLLITQDIEAAEFDLQTYNIIEYSTDIAEVGEFDEKLREIMGEIRNGEVDFGNPVTDFTDVTINTPSKTDTESNGTTKANGEPTEPEKGILDYAVEAQTKQANFLDSVSEIVEKTEELQDNIQNHASQINAVADSEEEVSPTRANRLARKAASDMKKIR